MVRAPRARLREALRLARGEDLVLIAKRSFLYSEALASFKQAFGEQGNIVLLAVASRTNWEGHHGRRRLLTAARLRRTDGR